MALSANCLDCRFYDKVKYTFIKFLKVFRCKYGKVVLFVDNASYHKAELVNKRMAEWNSGAALKYLPPYMPQLNSRGTVARVQKGNCKLAVRGRRRDAEIHTRHAAKAGSGPTSCG